MSPLLRRLLLGSAAAALLAALPASAASEQDILDRLDKMQKTIDAQQQQIEAQRDEINTLKKQVKTAPKPVKAASTPGGDVPAAPTTTLAAAPAQGSTDARLAAVEAQLKQDKIAQRDQPNFTFINGRPTFQTSDGRFTMAIRTRMQFDLAHYDQDQYGTLANDYRRGSVGGLPNRENTAARDLSDGGNFRRAQIGLEGKIANDFGYRIVYEVGGSGTEGPARLNEGWISYTGFAPFTFQVGAFAPPANLDDSASSDDTMFIERATPAELSRSLAGADGRYAIGVRGNGERWFAAVHFTGATYGDAETFDEQRAVIGRVGVLAFTGADYNVHVGGNISYVFHPADQGLDATLRNPIRFRDRPELRVDSTRLIDTGNLDAASAYAAGLEFAANYKNFNAQGEYFWYGADRHDPALSDPDFTAWYAEASWIVTGESKRYQIANGAFASPRASATFQGGSGTGAVELAVRYSHTDLNYLEGNPRFATTASGVRGGEQDIWTAGVNWYFNSNIRVTADYQWVDVDRLNPARPGDTIPFGAAPNTPPIGSQIGQSYQVLGVRFQFSL